ncbi:hypothetical protein [Streptomyces sp. NPDC051776]|uniref:hypothetical protein n=1 Tax=Streptomyces sp. NPDC051776 TaxID=3155414 RepID=UPI00343E5B0E
MWEDGGRKAFRDAQYQWWIALGAVFIIAGLGLLVSSPWVSGPVGRTDEVADTGLRAGPKPTLVLPTGRTPEKSPSASAKSSPSKSKPRRRSASPRPPKPEKPSEKPATYTSWAGPGCPTPAGGGYRELNRFSDGIDGWYTVSSGGYTGSGCDGSFTAMPMSGNSDDGHNRAVWWWTPSEDSDVCTISVYVPEGPNYRDVAGNPSYYEVFHDPNELYASDYTFSVDQISNRGRLVEGGTFPVQEGSIAVRLVGTGYNWDENGNNYHHHGAAQVKLTCHASA